MMKAVNIKYWTSNCEKYTIYIKKFEARIQLIQHIHMFEITKLQEKLFEG